MSRLYSPAVKDPKETVHVAGAFRRETVWDEDDEKAEEKIVQRCRDCGAVIAIEPGALWAGGKSVVVYDDDGYASWLSLRPADCRGQRPDGR